MAGSAVDALGGSSNSGGALSGGFSALSSEDFAKIIFTELSKQDPLQPNDTNALLGQISSLRSIQSNMDLSNSLKNLVTQNEFSSAATLMGKGVSGLSEEGERVAGIVRAIARTDSGTVVALDTGARVNVAQLDSIVAEAEEEAAASANTGDGT